MREIRGVVARRHRRKEHAVPLQRHLVERRHLRSFLGDLGRRELMPRLVEHRRLEVLRRLEARLEVLRALHLVEESLRHRLARLVVPGEVRHNLLVARPHLVELRRKLDPVARRAAREKRILRLVEEAVQRVAELVEERGHLVEGEQSRLALGGPGDVEVIRGDRLLAEQARLRHVRVHPRAALLVVALVVVANEEADLRPVRIDHVEHAHVRLVDGQVVSLFEADPVELVRRVEDAVLEDAVQLEVRFHGGLVEVVALPAELLRVKRPVPRCELEALPLRCLRLRIDDRHQIRGVLLRLGDRRGRELTEHPVDRLGRARGLLLERVNRPVLLSEERRLPGAQREDARDDAGVVCIAAHAARDRRLEEALAECAVGQVAQRRLHRRVLQRKDVLPLELAGLGGLRRRADLLPREAVEFLHVINDDRVLLRRLERVLAELRRQRRKLLVDFLELPLSRLRQLRPGAHELDFVALDELRRLRVEAELGALLVEAVDPREEGRIEEDLVPMRSELRRHLRLDLLHLRVSVGGTQRAEHGLYAVQETANLLERDEGVLERGRGRIVRDGLDFLEVRGHAGLESGHVVRVVDLVELRVMEWERAFLEEGVERAERPRGRGFGPLRGLCESSGGLRGGVLLRGRAGEERERTDSENPEGCHERSWAKWRILMQRCPPDFKRWCPGPSLRIHR